jgi:uncharacterized membrane protein YhaH (DUF805 family)
MLSVIKNEFILLFSNTRINRVRYIAYSGFLFMFLLTLVALTQLISKLNMTENSFPYKILACAVMIAYLVPKYWFVKRRVNDTDRSIWHYLMIIGLAMILIFLPTAMKVVASSLGYDIQSLSNIAKLTTALSYVVGMSLFVYAACVVIFFRGTTSENKYGSKPPANNYFIISWFILYLVMLATLNIVALTQIKKSVADAMQQKQAGSMATTQSTNFYMPNIQTNNLNTEGRPTGLNVNLE